MVTKEQVLQAAKQSTVEGALIELFPEYFGMVEIEPFQVDKKIYPNKLVYIGVNYAPDHLKNKCLVLYKYYNWEISSHLGSTILTPTKK